MRPVTSNSELSESEEALLAFVAEGKPIKAIAVQLGALTPEAVNARGSSPLSSNSPRR